MSKLSVIIITKNEGDNIRACLESIKWADEIIIVDDHSTDNTLNICRNYENVKIYERNMFDGFGFQKNYALNKASGDWILSIDADEIISERLREEMSQKIKKDIHSGYCLRRTNYILGKWITDYKAMNLRLFRKEKGRFRDVKVHESVELLGKIGELRSPLIHSSKNYVDINSIIRTIDRYSSLMAEDKFEKGIMMRGIQIPIRLLCIPIWYFLKKFFIHRGFKNGIRGFLLSLFSSVEYFLTYAKLWEKQKKIT